MTGVVTWEALAGAIFLLIAIGGVYWRWSSVIGALDRDLQAYKLHVSETFVTKQGQREQTEAILAAVNGIREDVKDLNGRIDRMLEAQHSARQQG